MCLGPLLMSCRLIWVLLWFHCCFCCSLCKYLSINTCGCSRIHSYVICVLLHTIHFMLPVYLWTHFLTGIEQHMARLFAYAHIYTCLYIFLSFFSLCHDKFGLGTCRMSFWAWKHERGDQGQNRNANELLLLRIQTFAVKEREATHMSEWKNIRKECVQECKNSTIFPF